MTKLIMVVAVIIVLSATTALLATAASAQETDPDAVFDEFVDAVNGGDVDAALALFTEDATWTRGGRCPPGACVGTDAIRGELQKDVADHHQIVIIEVEVSGSMLTGRTELRTDVTRAEGIERAIQTVTLEFYGEKISSLEIAPDFTDPMTAELRARRLPASGSGPQSSTDAGLPVALLLVGGLFLAGVVLMAGAFRMKTLVRMR